MSCSLISASDDRLGVLTFLASEPEMLMGQPESEEAEYGTSDVTSSRNHLTLTVRTFRFHLLLRPLNSVMLRHI